MTIWRIVDGRIVQEWSSLSETRAYIAMFAHLKWWLMLAGLLLLAIVIAVERLVWRMVRKIFAHQRRFYETEKKLSPPVAQVRARVLGANLGYLSLHPASEFL